MRSVWSEDIKSNLYKGLEAELDNKTFYNVSSLYKSASATTASNTPKIEETNSFTSLGHISFIDEQPESSFSSSSIKGMSFSNKIESDKKVNSVSELSQSNRKIYKIEDLLSANFAETTVIPLNTIPKNLSLVKRFEWREVLFADVGDAFNMIKARFFR